MPNAEEIFGAFLRQGDVKNWNINEAFGYHNDFFTCNCLAGVRKKFDSPEKKVEMPEKSRLISAPAGQMGR